MNDQFFTPADIAATLVAPFRSKREACIADFAAGDGELLKAAAKKWPKSKIIASDIESATVRALRRSFHKWSIGKCNFLDGNSRNRCKALRNALGTVTLILLNPPFSCRGSSRHTVDTASKENYKCSRAMAFVLSAIPFLAKKGRLAAILPASCLTSQKDSGAWLYVRKHFKVRVHESFAAWTFPECSARTVIVTLQRCSKPNLRSSTHRTLTKKKQLRVRLVRGATAIHEATNGLAGSEWSLVHTTNLKDSTINGTMLGLRDLHRHVSGPAVLLPRVGKPNLDKCALYLRRKRISLSDCVYAVACDSSSAAEELHSRLQNQWSHLIAPAFGGTCAPYLTVASLVQVLRRVGCKITTIEAASHQLGVSSETLLG